MSDNVQISRCGACDTPTSYSVVWYDQTWETEPLCGWCDQWAAQACRDSHIVRYDQFGNAV